MFFLLHRHGQDVVKEVQHATFRHFLDTVNFGCALNLILFGSVSIGAPHDFLANSASHKRPVPNRKPDSSGRDLHTGGRSHRGLRDAPIRRCEARRPLHLTGGTRPRRGREGACRISSGYHGLFGRLVGCGPGYDAGRTPLRRNRSLCRG